MVVVKEPQYFSEMLTWNMVFCNVCTLSWICCERKEYALLFQSAISFLNASKSGSCLEGGSWQRIFWCWSWMFSIFTDLAEFCICQCRYAALEWLSSGLRMINLIQMVLWPKILHRSGTVHRKGVTFGICFLFLSNKKTCKKVHLWLLWWENSWFHSLIFLFLEDGLPFNICPYAYILTLFRLFWILFQYF